MKWLEDIWTLILLSLFVSSCTAMMTLLVTTPLWTIAGALFLFRPSFRLLWKGVGWLVLVQVGLIALFYSLLAIGGVLSGRDSDGAGIGIACLAFVLGIILWGLIKAGETEPLAIGCQVVLTLVAAGSVVLFFWR